MRPSPLRAAVLCINLLVLAACGGKGQEPPKPPPPAVGVIKAQPQSAPLTKDLVGRLSAYRSADVRARVEGVVLKRAYNEGGEVKKGQLLFRSRSTRHRSKLPWMPMWPRWRRPRRPIPTTKSPRGARAC